MTMQKTEKIWMNGKFVDWDDARIHVLSHVVHYGSSVFEGFRAYDTQKGVAIFRLKDHIVRLFNSAKIYRMTIPFTIEEIMQACIDIIRVNKLRSAYLRPIVYRGYSTLGVAPGTCPIEVTIASLIWGKYLGDEALEQGVDVRVSSWWRMAPNTFPAMAKCGANYMNSQLVKMEAMADGYVEGICLDPSGYVSEGSGENIFVVTKNEIITPPLGQSILPGITRDSIMKIAKDLGYNIYEHTIPRELLYIADEIFFTGSAAEITPIRSIDRIIIGEGKRGPITKKLQEAFFEIIEGKVEDKYNWLTYV